MILDPLKNFINLLRKFWGMLDRKEKYGFFLICVLIFFGGLAEMIGIGAVVPLLAILLGDGVPVAKTNGKLSEILAYVMSFAAGDHKSALMYFTIGIAALFVMKNIFLGVVGWVQARWIYNLYSKMSADLYQAYLYAPYSFHLQENSARLIKNIQNMYYVAIAIAGPFISILTEGMVVLLLAFLLFITDPFITLFLLVSMSVLAVAWYCIIRGKIKKWGAAHALNDRMLMQEVTQSLTGIKSIKVGSKQEYLMQTYKKHTAVMSRCGALQMTASSSPRLFIESCMAVLVVIVLLFYMEYGMNGNAIVISLAIFAMASVRLMPSFNRVVSALVLSRYYIPAFDEILKDYSSLTPGARFLPHAIDKTYSFGKCIEIKNLSFTYAGTDKVVIDDINLSIPKNTSIGIVGSTGSGKTTLVDIILGLLEPQNGEVLIDGRPLKQEIEKFRNIVGYIPQETFLCDASIAENIAFCIQPDKIDYERIDDVLKSASLYEFVKGLPEGCRTFVGERGIRLSGGQRQRIAIARALYSKPEILIIDEGTSALDSQTEEAVMDAIKKLSGSMTVIAIAHRITTIMHCDKIIVLHEGKITDSGKFSDLQEKSEVFRSISRIPFK